MIHLTEASSVMISTGETILEEIIMLLDQQIALLTSARATLISSESAAASTGKRRGRPPGPKKLELVKSAKITKRVMTPEGKAKIAAAQKKRWAAAKKAAKSAAKKEATVAA